MRMIFGLPIGSSVHSFGVSQPTLSKARIIDVEISFVKGQDGFVGTIYVIEKWWGVG